MAATDYDYSLTRDQIIARAYRLVGATSTDQALTAAQLSDGVISLNSMIKEWQNDHIFLWTLREFTIDLVAGTASYAIEDDPAIMDLDSAQVRIGTQDRPLQVVSWREYFDLPDKTNAGTPELVCIDARLTPTLYFWPTPNDSTQDFRGLGIAKLKDAETSGAAGTMDFTQRWFGALAYGLALELAPEAGITLGERDWLQKKFDEKLLKAKRGDLARVTEMIVDGSYDP